MHEAGHGLLEAYTSYSQGNMQQVLTEGASILKTLTRTEQSREESRRTRTSPADVIQLSGCKNYQTSADAVEAVPPLL
jgi:metacaspase-1